jgi:hypothetical protein
MLGLALFLAIAAVPARGQVIGELGVGLTPAHFPNHGAADVAGMYQEVAHIGGFAVLNFRWNDPALGRVSEQMLQLAEQYRVQPIVQLDILQPGGWGIAGPSGVGQRFDQAFIDAYAATVRQLAEQRPPYLAVATDINRLLGEGTDRLASFAQVYKRIYREAKQVSPNTKVFVTFNWDIFRNAAQQHHIPVSALRTLVDLFRPEMDVLAMSSVPSDQFSEQTALPVGYYQAIADLRANEPILLQAGWPSASGGDGGQAAFVDRIPVLLGNLNVSVLTWPILHDISAGPPLVASLGLYRSDDSAKPAAERFHLLHPVVAAPVATLPPVAPAGMTAQRRDPADKFAIYTSSLTGTDRVLLISDPSREINHARVSPDGTHFVFTRYNRRNRDGEALEVTSYLQTEIVICRMDGGGCQVAVPPRAGIVAANATWMPDGKHLLLVTNDRPSRQPGISEVDLGTGISTPWPSPDNLELADPQTEAGRIVVAGKPMTGARVSRIFLFDPATGKVQPVSTPTLANVREMDPPLGDHDPKLSPDGREVALMRHLDTDDWAVFVVDLATRTEHDLSGPHPVDAVPEWSPDEAVLIFWHVERGDLKQSGLYTMRPDGSDRRRVMLPHGFFYSMPAFVPGPGGRIIYASRVDPNL